MIVDRTWLDANPVPPVAIIGSGPAGMSLALRLEEQGVPSIIFEAGDVDPTVDSQDFYRGDVVGDPYFDLDVARLRMLGGSSNHWGGWCRPLEEFDFLPREDVANMGWPIRKSDLDPYHAGTEEILEVGGFETREFSNDLKEVTLALGNPVNFATKYRDHIANSQLITLMLNAAVEYVTAENGRVRTLVMRDSRINQRFEVEPQRVVLACGGIENSRILLWSNEVSTEPVVPNADALGRYWMEHPTFTVGEAKLHGSLQRRLAETVGVMFVAPQYEAMRRHGVLNANLRVHRATDNAIAANAICPALRVSTPVFSAAGGAYSCENLLRMSWEQAPDRDNRIELGEERDAYGVPRTVLHWRKTDLDLRTARVCLELFGKSLVEDRAGNARALEFIRGDADYPEDDELAGYHHMGGTRMAESAQSGVVDGNLRVFGTDNLYVAGSSVYPTGGHTNPTFTIVQLSLRLGDHLAGAFA